MRARSLGPALVPLLLTASLLAGCGGGAGTPGTTGAGATATGEPGGPAITSTEAPTGGGTSDPTALVRDRCTGCHGVSRIKQAQHDEAGWSATVQRMRSKGAKLSDGEAKEVVSFLASGGASQL